MPHPTWEDLSDFFDPNEFASIAIITRASENIGEVLGIFDDPNHVASLGEYDLDYPVPKFMCAEADIVALKRGDVVTIEGKDFDLIEEPKLDGTGIATLILGKPNVTYNAGL